MLKLLKHVSANRGTCALAPACPPYRVQREEPYGCGHQRKESTDCRLRLAGVATSDGHLIGGPVVLGPSPMATVAQMLMVEPAKVSLSWCLVVVPSRRIRCGSYCSGALNGRRRRPSQSRRMATCRPHSETARPVTSSSPGGCQVHGKLAASREEPKPLHHRPFGRRVRPSPGAVAGYARALTPDADATFSERAPCTRDRTRRARLPPSVAGVVQPQNQDLHSSKRADASDRG
jgi:hypothetical protein